MNLGVITIIFDLEKNPGHVSIFIPKSNFCLVIYLELFAII